MTDSKKKFDEEQKAAYSALFHALSFVVSPADANINCTWLRAPLAYHLTRCGFRLDESKQVLPLPELKDFDINSFDPEIVPKAERKRIAEDMLRYDVFWSAKPS